MTTLPTNIDATYPDDPNDPSVKLHQQHHDTLHALNNSVGQADGLAQLGSDGLLLEAQRPPAGAPALHAGTHASNGADPVTLAQSQVSGLSTDLAARALTTDPRFTDQRVPTDDSVTNVKVATGAEIAQSKIANLPSDLAARALTTDPRFTDQRVPTNDSVTNAKVAPGAAIEESKLALASDAAANVASRRTLGTGATQAAAGNDSRFSNAATSPLAVNRRLMQAHKNPSLATFSVIGQPGLTLSGITNGDDSDGPWGLLTTGAVAGNEAVVRADATMAYRREWDLDFAAIVKAVSTTFVRIWVGLTSAPNNMGGDDVAFHVAAFRFSTDVDSGTTWRAYTNNGTNPGLVTDTGVALATTGLQRLRVTTSSADVKFYIDGTLVATHTSDLPGLVSGLAWTCRLETREAVAKTMRVGRTALEMRG